MILKLQKCWGHHIRPFSRTKDRRKNIIFPEVKPNISVSPILRRSKKGFHPFLCTFPATTTDLFWRGDPVISHSPRITRLAAGVQWDIVVLVHCKTKVSKRIFGNCLEASSGGPSQCRNGAKKFTQRVQRMPQRIWTKAIYFRICSIRVDNSKITLITRYVILQATFHLDVAELTWNLDLGLSNWAPKLS